MTAVKKISLLAVAAGLVLSLAAVSQETAQPLRADRILIEKSERRMTLLWKGTPVTEIEEIWDAVPNGTAVEIRP